MILYAMILGHLALYHSFSMCLYLQINFLGILKLLL